MTGNARDLASNKGCKPKSQQPSSLVEPAPPRERQHAQGFRSAAKGGVL